ncbi:MAG: hypothetical protein L6R48_21965, partial [Planctomycetes bacterium]|nr:hypothetical protein [Planctomycetota bacterium]
MRLHPLLAVLALLPLTAAEPLTVVPAASDATAASDRWSDWDLAALPAGEPSDGWRGGTIVRPADGLAALVLTGKQAVSTSRRHTVAIDPGEPLELEVAWSGGAGQVHAAHYALGTWGNTVAEDRFPLPAGAEGQRRAWTLTPRPGALSLGVWITRQGEAPLQLQQVRLSGRPWGGVAYPVQARPAWQVWELAGGTVPVNSQHAGPGSRVTALRCRGGGGAEEAPWIPAGALLPATAGTCRVALEAVEPGGGPVVRQWAGDLAVGAGRVVLPSIDRSLDLRAWAWDAAGTLVRQSALRLRLIPRAPVDAPAGWAGTPAVVPLHPGGALTIALTGARVRPLPADGVLTGTIAVEPGSAARVLTVVATRHDRQVVLQREQPIPAAGELVPVTIPADRPDTYLLRTELRQDGRLVDASELELGCNDARPPAAAVPAPLPRPLLVEEQVFPARRNAPAVDRLFGDYVDDCVANGSTVIGIGVNLADLAPLPGHHRFDDLDARVARVKAAGRAA